MKLGVLSDTHNNADNARRALKVFREYRVEHLIHCGDLTTPEIVSLFEGWQVAFVYGNMDRQKGALQTAVEKLENAQLAMEQSLEFDGRRVAVCHGHIEETLHRLINSSHDYVFHGHTHRRLNVKDGSTHVINPGALGGAQYEARSVCVVDLDSNDIEFVRL